MLTRALLAATSLLLLLPQGAAATTSSAPPLPLGCATYGEERVCSGEVPSFDGAPLDVDLTLPMTQGARHPLMVMLHGFGNNKHEWESLNDTADGADKWHWNSHWFAEHGYYVLTYTARGFQDHGPTQLYQPHTPASQQASESAPNGTIHLKSREFEGRDTQYLSALVAAGHSDLDTGKVAVTGGSYGGGEAWLQAAQPQWSAGPGLPVLHLQVAIPKYPWSDLGYSLAPNGHPGGPGGDDLYMSATGKPDDAQGAGEPIGVPKASYVAGFYAIGSQDGAFEKGTTTPTYSEGPINIDSWSARVMGTGDPYDAAGAEDPLVTQVRRGLTVYRSAYYQDGWAAQAASGHEVAVFSVSGWTDDLFPPVESFRMFKYLKGLDRLWPVEVATADVGHPRAQNKGGQWQRINDQANQFLNANINGSHRQETGVLSQPTICGSDSAGDMITAPTPEALARGRLNVSFATGGTLLAHPGAADPNGPATDPVLSSQAPSVVDVITPDARQCRTSPGPALGGRTLYSAPLPRPVTMIGIPDVRMHVHLAGVTGSIDVRLWDVDPNGSTLLVSRGAYRFDVPAYDSADEVIRVPFFGNHWTFPAGHRLRVDVTQADSPAFRPATTESSVTFEGPVLEVPIHDAAEMALTGA